MSWQRRRPRAVSPEAAPAQGGRISAISQQRDPNRVSVFLDGEFAFGLTAGQLLSEGLTVGQELSAERVGALRALSEIGLATEAALHLVARRPRSTHEIEERLRRRGFAPEAIAAALERLENWHYVDDADFARYWVEQRERHRPRGRRLLEQELRHKGVDRETVRETIDRAELDEEASALAIGRAKLRAYAGLEPAVARRRLGSLLARRGYDLETVRRVLDQLLTPDTPEESES